jgi:hypothetical protein
MSTEELGFETDPNMQPPPLHLDPELHSAVQAAMVPHRTMYDSTDMTAIPAHAEIVAGYPHAFPTRYDLFPHAVHIRIDNHGDHADDCDVLDVETGAASPAVAALWIQSYRVLRRPGKPTIYCNKSTLPLVRAACDVVGVNYDVWVASLGIPPVPYPGASATQYAWPQSAQSSGGNYDVSLVTDPAWHPSAVTPPPPPPPPAPEGVVVPYGYGPFVGQAHSVVVRQGPAGVWWHQTPEHGATVQEGVLIPFGGSPESHATGASIVRTADGGKSWR